MRALTVSTILIALAIGTPAFAQGTSPKSQQSQPQSQAQQAPVIRSVQVLEVESLPQDVRTQVDALTKRTTEKDLRSLRESIDASPEISSVLKAKGFSSAQVVAINIDNNGLLTLFAKKAA